MSAADALERHALTAAQRARLPGLSEAEVDDAIRAQRDLHDDHPIVPLEYLDTEPPQVADVEPWAVESYAPEPREIARWGWEGAALGVVVFLIIAAVYWSELTQLRDLLRQP
jgi:hypothetical protein